MRRVEILISESGKKKAKVSWSEGRKCEIILDWKEDWKEKESEAERHRRAAQGKARDKVRRRKRKGGRERHVYARAHTDADRDRERERERERAREGGEGRKGLYSPLAGPFPKLMIRSLRWVVAGWWERMAWVEVVGEVPEKYRRGSVRARK